MGRRLAAFWCGQVGCDPHWTPLGSAAYRQCRRCGTVSAIHTQAPPPVTGMRHNRWVQAIQPTDDRVAEDWGPGFLD